MIAIFVHGWSVHNSATYGHLPERVAKEAALRGLPIDVGNLFLSQYVSFRDEVTVDDLARGLEQAIRETVMPRLKPGERFAIITHSTGGPVARKWLDLYYGPARLAGCPMSHLIMLAPANSGSALGQLGKSRVARLKYFAEGLTTTGTVLEPGQHVLDWLELGSQGQWELNLRSLGYDYVASGVFPMVLTGQSIDSSFYDHLNGYTAEPGSDGVVRVCSANLNFSFLQLEQEDDSLSLKRIDNSPAVAFGVLPGLSHSGENMGILGSVKDDDAPHPTVEWVMRCLEVRDPAGYQQLSTELDALTAETQAAELTRQRRQTFTSVTYFTPRYSMLTFRLRDDRGSSVADYDLLLTAGPQFSEDDLPPGFFRDRQRNSLDTGRLTYYLNHDVMEQLNQDGREGKMGFRIVGRPDRGLARYSAAELRSDAATVENFLRPNQTTLVEIVLKRKVTSGVYRLTGDLKPRDFSSQDAGDLLPFMSDALSVKGQMLLDLATRIAAATDPAVTQQLSAELTRLMLDT